MFGGGSVIACNALVKHSSLEDDVWRKEQPRLLFFFARIITTKIQATALHWLAESLLPVRIEVVPSQLSP